MGQLEVTMLLRWRKVNKISFHVLYELHSSVLSNNWHTGDLEDLKYTIMYYITRHIASVTN